MTLNGSNREKKWSKSKFENIALPMGPWVPDFVIFCQFWKMKSIFSTLAGWIWLILHIMIVLIVLNHLTTTNYLCGWRKYAKCGQLCRKKVKILIFDCFFDCECLNQLEIADYDSINCSTPLDNQWLPDLWSKLFNMRWNLQKKLQNTEVEEVQSTLQFSTSVLNFSWGQTWECYQ